MAHLNLHDSTSPSLSARSPSPNFSGASAAAEQANWDSSYEKDANASGSRAISPGVSEKDAPNDAGESVTCQWEGCGLPFSQLQTLIDHIHNLHIGVNKSTYTCEWGSCPRRGMSQASRSALITHIRAHTGEKPYICPLPECDKSFTRSDAMQKHMRLQHNIEQAPPVRGGNRKRKRGNDEAAADVDPPPQNQSGAASFKVEGYSGTPPVGEPSTNVMDNDDMLTPSGEMDMRHGSVDYFAAGAASISNNKKRRSASPDSDPDDPNDNGLPQYLQQQIDPVTGKILGRTPDMCRYLVMKAKHRFALEQHTDLLEELRVARNEERQMREEKERALDLVLRSCLGPQAEFLIQDVVLPPPQPQDLYPVPVDPSSAATSAVPRY